MFHPSDRDTSNRLSGHAVSRADHPVRPSANLRLSRSEFELDCIREFAHSGVQIGPSVSPEERRERIRAAILRENKQADRWRDTTVTYAGAYRQVYGRALTDGCQREDDLAPMRKAAHQAWSPLQWEDDDSTEDADETAGSEAD